MKYFFYIPLAFLLSITHTQALPPGLKPGPSGFIPRNYCFGSGPLNCFVNQKLNSSQYGIVCNDGDAIHEHGIVSIPKEAPSKYLPIGRLNIYFEWIGQKKMDLDNGYDTTVDLWRACDPNSNPKRY